MIAAAPHQLTAEHLLLFDLSGNHAAQVAAVVGAGQWTCPTLVAMDRVRPLKTLRQIGIEGDDHVAPALRQSWQSTLSEVDVPKEPLKRVLRDIAAAGGGMLVGTDANVPFLVPGWSMHDELAMIVETGISPYDDLRAATFNAAAFFDEVGRSGTVEQGRVADLVLLDRNPIDDIAATHAGGMVKGRWYSAAMLADMLAQIKVGRAQ